MGYPVVTTDGTHLAKVVGDVERTGIISRILEVDHLMAMTPDVVFETFVMWFNER